ncbi:hypothetical protein FQR65_LT00633 [Abscondita terminalis]|nr:hypothetical protein FQR65_LT00633 [Abscondita terminalis]
MRTILSELILGPSDIKISSEFPTKSPTEILSVSKLVEKKKRPSRKRGKPPFLLVTPYKQQLTEMEATLKGKFARKSFGIVLGETRIGNSENYNVNTGNCQKQIIFIKVFNLFLLKMGDEFENGTVVASGNQDELIMQQQRQIEREISESTSLVGDLEPISSLNNEYSNDVVYLEKIKDLASKYKYIRRTRPDGNCFFRAFTYAKLERLLDNKNDFTNFYKMVESSKDALVELGFPQFTVEDFYDTFIDVLKRLGDIKTGTDSKKELHILFNDQGYSDYMVVYLRLLTSGQLQRDQEFYSCFIEGERTVADFCHQEVEPMYKESDHIHIMAACAAMSTGVRVVYMDRGTSKTNIEHDLPEGSQPSVHLLYRPGHYDILYL